MSTMMDCSGKEVRAPRKILILGASGWIGSYCINALSERLGGTGGIIGTYGEDHTTLSCSGEFIGRDDSGDAAATMIRRHKPEIVLDMLRGHDATARIRHQRIVKEVDATNAFYLFMSSAAVFGGVATHPHEEEDRPLASDEYGAYKIACEEDILNTRLRAAIIRISAVHGYSPRSLSRTERFLQKLQKGEQVSINEGVVQNRLYISDLADILADLILKEATGTFHIGTTDASEESDFLSRVAELFGYSRERLDIIPGKPRNLTVLPHAMYAVLGDTRRISESRTLTKIASTPMFEKYQRTPRSFVIC